MSELVEQLYAAELSCPLPGRLGAELHVTPAAWGELCGQEGEPAFPIRGRLLLGYPVILDETLPDSQPFKLSPDPVLLVRRGRGHPVRTPRIIRAR